VAGGGEVLPEAASSAAETLSHYDSRGWRKKIPAFVAWDFSCCARSRDWICTDFDGNPASTCGKTTA
jgi:hypothetical protein